MPPPASTVVIEEIAGARRRLELRGAGLPFRGVGFPVMQKLTTTWYPGNAGEATQHVLGPEDSPTSFEGEWNTTRLIRTPALFSENGNEPVQIVRAATLVTILDAIARSGSLLRVTWAAVGAIGIERSRIMREGRIREFDPVFDRVDDVRWSVEFEWTGRGARQARVKVRSDDLQANTSALINAANEAQAAIEAAELVTAARDRAARKQASRFTLGQLEALAEGPNDLMRQFAQFANNVTNRVRRLGDLVIKVRSLPLQLAEQAIDVASNAVAVANQFVDQITRQPPELASTKNKVSAMTRSTSYFNGGAETAQDVANRAAEYRRSVRRRRSALGTQTSAGRNRLRAAEPRDILTVHIAREGDTFIGLSNRYYGTPDKGAEIAVANGLPAYQTEPDRGEVIVIPTLRTIESLEAV